MRIGTLYLVSTPIGNLDDMSARAIKTLSEVNCIAAEDTRHSGRLLKHFQINTQCISLHDHNELQRSHVLVKRLLAGENIALISDAGTPLISDPGYQLVNQVAAEGIQVVAIPGACAVIAALSISGLPTDRFYFEGFLPVKSGARKQRLQALANQTCTLIFYESPHRVLHCLQDACEVLGDARLAVVAREITKLYETVERGMLAELLLRFQQQEAKMQGEFVILIHGKEKVAGSEDLDEAVRVLKVLQKELSVKQAAKLASQITGVSKNYLYQVALEGDKT
jgi:16S rRNA (cytidine1402-2'-O)-methyltransferase